jgi:hypothetical protein
MHALARHQVDATAEKLFQPQLDASEFDQVGGAVKFDEQVDIQRLPRAHQPQSWVQP